MTTDSYTRDKRSMMNWVAGIVAVLMTSALGVVATQLSAHETAINVQKEKQSSQEKRLDSMDLKLDKILDRLPPK